jgi:hypothetical protein
MRLEILRKKSGLLIRTLDKALGFTPGPQAVMRYRPQFFGRYYAAALRNHLEHGAAWNRGERELFAAFVSALNQCVF